MLLAWLREGLYILEITLDIIWDIFSEPKPSGEFDPTKINMVLVYGFLSAPVAFVPLKEKLKAHGYNVLVPDIGITIGDIDFHARKLVGFFQQQDKLLQEKYGKILPDLKNKIILFGHSMGGLIILAAQRIDRELLNMPVITVGTPLKGTDATIPVFGSIAARQMFTDSEWLKKLRQDLKINPRKIFHISARQDEVVPLSSSFLDDHPSEITKIIGHVALLYETELEDIFRKEPG